jgi:hypothetical protein
MALTGKNAGAIKKWSGGEMWIKQVNADGTDLASPDSFRSLGYIEQGKFSDITETEDYPDETGEIIASVENTRTVTIEALFMQSSKEILDFVGDECRNKFYALYRYEGIVAQKHQELFFPLVKVTPQIQLEAGTKRPPFKATALKAPAAISLVVTAIPAKAEGPIAIAKDKYYSIVETPISGS